jgi:hypothetical protein
MEHLASENPSELKQNLGHPGDGRGGPPVLRHFADAKDQVIVQA